MCLFLNQHRYSLLFRYPQGFYTGRLSDSWVNISKSTHGDYKGQTLSLPSSASSFPNDARDSEAKSFSGGQAASTDPSGLALGDSASFQTWAPTLRLFYPHAPLHLGRAGKGTRAELSRFLRELGFHKGVRLP